MLSIVFYVSCADFLLTLSPVMSKFEFFELYDCPVQGLLLLAGTDLKKVSGGEIGVFAVD